MGYPTVANFDKIIIERTKENLDNSSYANDFTQLLNSLFGLIILPNQMQIQGKRDFAFFDTKISDYDKLEFLLKDTEYTILDEKKGGKFEEIKIRKLIHKHTHLNNIKISEFIERMRNAVAHNGIRPTKDGNNWGGIIIRSYNKDKHIFKWGDNYDFQLFLTQSELKEICNFLTNKYLDEINGKN